MSDTICELCGNRCSYNPYFKKIMCNQCGNAATIQSSYKDNIIKLIDKQIQKGISKYGQPLEQTDRDIMTSIEFLEEELVDALVYIQELKQKINEVK